MEIKNLYEPFELSFQEVDTYEAKKHKNTFFEMVFVLEGNGIQIINEHRLPYSKNKLFLIFPEDSHHFEVETASQFFFIRFNTSYLKTQSNDWVKKVEFILNNHDHLPGCILKTITDKPLVRALVEALMRESTTGKARQEEVIRQLLNTIITITVRNMSLSATASTATNNTENATHLLNYIHHHIYQPDLLKTEKIALHFHVSPTYISEYFKTKTGEGIQQYIISYKLKLVETRLRYTNMQMNEIVDELGFSDASHLNRLFKKHKGMNPSEYRKLI